MGLVKLSWDEFLSEANTKKVIKSGSWVILCWNKSNKTKKLVNIWDLSNYVGMNFLAKQTPKK